MKSEFRCLKADAGYRPQRLDGGSRSIFMDDGLPAAQIGRRARQSDRSQPDDQLHVSRTGVWSFLYPDMSLVVYGVGDFMVTKLIGCNLLVYFLPLLLVTLPVAAAVQPDEASLRAADAAELQNVLTGDANAMRSLMHPNYMVNSPVNQVVRKDQLIKLLSEGKIASESIERTIEATAITGNVGIVMGRETVIPKPNSELGLAHGVKTLERRFTNVFVFDQGNWRLLARQSTVIQASQQ
jgi:hypothetical protein